jgi:outer membrane biosynthesis protein TonB
MPPPLLDYVEPHAPPRGASGTVIVEAVVETDGTVRRVRPLRGAADLTDLVVDAVGRWRYARMCLNGQPVPAIVVASLRYGAIDMR